MMQDKEGYMELEILPQRDSPSTQPGNQAPSPARPRFRHCLVVLGAGCVSLALAVIVLSRVRLQGCPQGHQTRLASPGAEDDSDAQGSGSGAEGSHRLQSLRSHLRESLCEQPQDSAAGGARCKLCPSHWVKHRDKCYWLSDGSKYWSGSRDDCTQRRSHLLVIQDQEEMVFIQNIIGDQNPVWIGLNITSPERKWTWVDGSPLNQALLWSDTHTSGTSSSEEERLC
ncbi:C-type lectin domain family 7 member A-like isoform X1 [Pelodiscus sinensis]|uniref:C-type lectin domain family 7 member A-like isoform X1 n=1 Tax=Pelodiscus sinensis TaxID=13735 RepID=UPI003F6ACE57